MAYCDVDFADNYANTKIDGNKWLELTQENKEKYLEEATRRIDLIFGINIPKEITNDIKMACSDVAINLVVIGGNNPHEINQKLGITSISFGNDTVSYKNEAVGRGSSETAITDYAMALLSKYIKRGYNIV